MRTFAPSGAQLTGARSCGGQKISQDAKQQEEEGATRQEEW